MALRPLVLAAVAAASLAWAAPARADVSADLEKAHNAYVAKQYGEAESRLRALLDPKSEMKDPDMIAEARMYLGATLLAEVKKDEANAVFETLLLDKPDYQGDPLRVSLDAVNALTDARARVREKIAAILAEKVRKAQEEKARLEALRLKEVARLALLEKLAQEQTITHESSRWLALVPFGVGQFQNRKPALGWLFLGSELVIGAAVATTAIGSYVEWLAARDAHARSDFARADAYRANAQGWATANYVSFAAFALAAIGGVVQAELAFVPSYTEVKQRPLPRLALTPIAAPIVAEDPRAGGILGVAGTF